MLKKLSFASGLRGSSGSSSSTTGFASKGEKGKVVKYSYSSSKKKHDDDDDDLDEVAVISNATPQNVTYGDRGVPLAGGSLSAGSSTVLSSNGPPPRIVPGIITSTGFESKPYVPATCSMQPKISSSVIQSTAGLRSSKGVVTSPVSLRASTMASYSTQLASTAHEEEYTLVTSSRREGHLGVSDKNNKASQLLDEDSGEASQEGDRLLPSHDGGLRRRFNESTDTPIQTISSKVTTDKSSQEDEGGLSPSVMSSQNLKTAIFASKSSGSPGFIITGDSHPMTTASGSPSSQRNLRHQVILSKKVREQRRKEMKKELEKSWMNSGPSLTSPIEKSGCNWSFVFDPSGRLVYYWSMIVSLAFLYNSWVIIYRFAFDEIKQSTALMWLSMDFTADIIYLVDVMIHFRIGFLEEGVLQTHPAKLRQHYMNSTIFYIDCLCLLPLDFLYLSMGFNSIFRVFRLVKIYRFWSFLDRTERHTNYPNVFRTVSLFHYILVLFHWNACLYHLISARGGFGSSDWFEGSRDSESCSDVDCDYLHAFYWSTLALTTIGDLPRPRTKGEYLFLIIELVLGLFLLATVLGHVANIVTNVSAARKEFQAKLDSVKTYMRMRRVPEHLKIKVIKWFDYLWMTQKSSDEEKSVGFLPAKLKAEIAIHVHLDTLKRVEIFQNTEAGFLCALVLRLKPVLFSPSDFVCRKGEIGKEMYIVNRGKLQVVADNGKTVLATLRAGSYFGEISILNMGTAGNRRTASVRSVGYSDLFCLNKNDMWDVLKDYPAARVRLEAIAVKRLEKYRKEPLKKISMGRSRSTPGLADSKTQLNSTCTGKSAKEPQREVDDQVDEQVDDQEHATGRSILSSTNTSPENCQENLKSYPPPLYSTLSESVVITMPSNTPLHTQRVSPPLMDNPSTGLLDPSLHPLPRTPVPGEVSQEVLIQEIKNLRQRLHSMEAENVSMTLKLSQQQNSVELRLKEIESQFASRSMPETSSSSTVLFSPKSQVGHDEYEKPNSKPSSEVSSVVSTPTSGDDSERNKESII